MYQSFLFYKSDCTAINPWDSEVKTQISSIQDSIDMADILLSQRGDIETSCGANISPILDHLESLRVGFENLATGMGLGIQIAQCDRISPLYKR